MLAAMTASFARRERQALCDLARQLGPDAPTLCAGWDAADLFAHLVVRERNPVASLGNVLPALAGRNSRAMARRQEQPFETMVATYETPALPLRAVPVVDRMMNGFELLVHHEDLRRGTDGWEPRALPAEDLDLLWSQLSRGVRFFGRRLPGPTVLRRADSGATVVAKKGDEPVTITGDVVELVLFLFGRSATRGLEFEGPEDAVAAVRSADLRT
jgi:uncharacterized protein (TIGR03085 family)